MRVKTPIYIADFETTVYDQQTRTDVWASAMVEINTEDVIIHHSIDETFEYIKNINKDIIIYYHNLKFDGTFWIDYLLNVKHFTQCYTREDALHYKWDSKQDMINNSFGYVISDMGQWYTITIKVNNHYITIKDSLKLLPFSVKAIGKAFNTKHQKLSMEYKGYRYPGCEITDEEKKYIANDVLVVKEALEIMFSEGHTKLTIGACCLDEFKKLFGKFNYETMMPNLFNIEIDSNKYGSDNAGDYIRKSYHGGWCYLVKGKENIKYYHGTTADVNSLYPSMMHSDSGNYYPVGQPYFWKGNYIPDVVHLNDQYPKYFFIRIKTKFYLKPGRLPTIQIKGSKYYKSTEYLETSDIVVKGKRYPYVIDGDLEKQPVFVTLTLTMTDFYLIQEQYDLVDMEILDGCWFYSEKGLFDSYINKYRKIKMESKGAKRTLAKLFLNNLYGKMASTTNSNNKIAFVKEDGSIGFLPNVENNKTPGYIAIGSAITSYARNFTIRAAQKNYHGKDLPGFIYADTDSIHCDLDPSDIKGIKVHDSAFNCWKLESCWDVGIFARQKTYIEHIVAEDLKPIDKPYYNIKCAGMPDTCKNIFDRELQNGNKTLNDFKIGLCLPGKLLPKRIPGGTILQETTFEMR